MFAAPVMAVEFLCLCNVLLVCGGGVAEDHGQGLLDDGNRATAS
jgi:hypothetical protein